MSGGLWGLLGGPAAESLAACHCIWSVRSQSLPVGRSKLGAHARKPTTAPMPVPRLDSSRPLLPTDRFLSFPSTNHQTNRLFSRPCRPLRPQPFFSSPSSSRCELSRQPNRRIPRLPRAHPLWPPPSQNTNDPEPRHTTKRGGASLQTPTNGLTRVPRSPRQAVPVLPRTAPVLVCSASLPDCLCLFV